MKVTLSRSHLSSLLTKIQNITPPRPITPIFGNLLLEALDDSLIISATDGLVSMRIYTDAKVQEEGAIALPSRQFITLIRELTAPVVEIHTDPVDLAHINSGASHFKIRGMLKQEFPHIPEIIEGTPFSLSNRELKELLSRSSFSAAKSDTQNLLNSISFQTVGSQTFFMTTDGKRLTKIPFRIASSSMPPSCLIPLKTAEELIHSLDTKEEELVTIRVSSDKIAFEMRAITLISKLFTGQYPDVGKIIPTTTQETISLHKEELISLLKQICLFTSENHPSARFSFVPGELHISVNGQTTGEGVVKMPVNYTKAPLDIAFNPVYILDILRHIKDETVNLSVTHSHDPGLLTDSTTAQFLVMPMRLD